MALGVVSGLRTFSGPAALTFRHRAGLRRAAALLAAGEMVADKLPFIPDRVAPFPLVARASSGAIVGGIVAREEGAAVRGGALIGAVCAVGAAFAAFYLRRRSPLPDAVNGMLEDALVFGIGAWLIAAAPRPSPASACDERQAGRPAARPGADRPAPEALDQR